MSRRNFFEQERKKRMVTTFSLVVLLSIVACVTIFVMYSQKLDKDAEKNLLALKEQSKDVVPNDDIEPTSISKDKTINTVNEVSSIPVKIEPEKNTISENVVRLPKEKEPVTAVLKEEKNNISEEQKKEEIKNQEKSEEELSFQAPIVGEIIKDYAMDTLVYSQTLDEWCTHSGIDIKADKASAVCASEKGIVESIKNDPRYGLSIIINHGNDFKTVYANLLTTEFVKEGEEVEKGQTIATVGETASFEIADESHLHFEMYKDGISVNPTIYFK